MHAVLPLIREIGGVIFLCLCRICDNVERANICRIHSLLCAIDAVCVLNVDKREEVNWNGVDC